MLRTNHDSARSRLLEFRQITLVGHKSHILVAGRAQRRKAPEDKGLITLKPGSKLQSHL
jgi:hypothetical protein